jgi:glycerate dehydrogenase
MESVFLDYGTVSSGDLDATGLTTRLPGLRLLEFTEDADIAAKIGNAEVVLLNQLNLTRELIGAAPRLALIALAATGTDNVDLAAAREHGVAVCNVRGYCTPSVTQHVWAMILALTQRLPAIAEQRSCPDWWKTSRPSLPEPPIRELAGRTLGIVGWGELGASVARIGEAFGMRILVANRPQAAPQDGRLDLDDVLGAADVVSLHCPLSAATRGMIGARQLALMKSDALLINTARGALVDGHALAAALRAGRLGGAGIDVLPQEPPVDGDPLLDRAIPNLVLTPHVAWAAREARQRCLDDMALSVEQFFRGGNRGRVV